MEQIDVSIIIVNYNTLHVLLPCLDSIVQFTRKVSYEIIVIDNGSADGSKERLSNDSRLFFINSGANLGFGRANNLGLAKAKGKYVFFLNSDTLLKNNAIDMMYDFAESYTGRLGALGCILEDSNGCRIHSYGPFPKTTDAFRKLVSIPFLKAFRLYRQPEVKYPETFMPVDYITGADLFVSREVLAHCGAFHPAFFMYFEETEMELRFHRKGYDNILINGPRIVHLEGEGSKDGKTSKFLRDTLRQQKSEYIYFKLTESKSTYLAYRIIHLLLRQTMWFNPHASLADKWTLFKQLFVTIKV